MPYDGKLLADPNQDSSFGPEDPSFGQVLGTLLRGKWVIISILAVFLLAAIVYLRIANPVYEATAQILINPKSPDPDLFNNNWRRLGIPSSIAQNELQILKSQSLAMEVAERLYARRHIDSLRSETIQIIQPALDSGYSAATMNQIRAKVSNSVDFEVVPETDVVTISAISSDGREAALIANTFGEVYSSRNVSASRSKTKVFREFLEGQLIDKRKQMSEAENNLTAYMKQYGIVSLDGESRKLVDQMARLEAQRDETDLNIRTLNSIITSYEEQIPDQEKNLAKEIGEANDPYIRLLQEQLAALEVQRDVTIAQNPSLVGEEIYAEKMKELDDQISTLRGNLQKRTNDYIKTIMPEDVSSDARRSPGSYLKSVKEKIVASKIELQSLLTRMDALKKTLSKYDSEFAQLPEKNIEFARLDRTKLSTEKVFLALQDKYNEAAVTEQSEFGYVDIVDRASTPLKPSRPKPMLILLLGIFGGLCFGIVVVFLRERLDVKVHAPLELKRQGFLVAGTIMQIPDGPKGQLNGRRFALDSPFSGEAESFRHLRTSLTYARRDQPLHTILITSSKPGEGKTTVAYNLSIAFAQSGKRVVLIDADLRKPSLHGIFDLRSEPGLSDYLNNATTLHDIIQKTSFNNLSLVSCGSQVMNPAELLGSATMNRCVGELKNLYDLVVIDTSPVLAGTDPSVIAAVADEVLMIASAGNTRLNELQHAVELLEKVVGKKLTVVLNNFDVRRAYGIQYGYSGFGYYNDAPNKLA